MRFNYQARTQHGEIQAGTVEAGSRESAIETLQRHGLTVVLLETTSAVPFYARSLKFLQRVKTKDIVMFYRQLAVLFEANIPPLEALESLANQVSNSYFKDVLFEIGTDVRGGEPLSNALAKHKKIFSLFYINVIRSGEATGKLSEVLKYLADHAEKDYTLNQKIKGAFIYPIFILSAFLVIAVLMLIYVIPQLTTILLETGQKLPLATRILVGMSNILKSWLWLLIIIVAGFIFGLRRYLKIIQGRENWDKLKLKIPFLGGLFRKIYLTRFSENFSTLLKGGLPILSALKISGEVVGNTVYSHLIEEAMEEVKGGGDISSVFGKHKEIVPAMVVQMLKIGEQTARMESILERLAEFYKGEVDNLVNNITQLIEPFLIILLGGGVAFLVASILMPIYNITSGGF